jgi:hypothetical protein
MNTKTINHPEHYNREGAMETHDMEFVMDIMIEIAEYAKKNQMEPDETIRTVAENMVELLEIITMNHYVEVNHA